jgi:hypothetical protein
MGFESLGIPTQLSQPSVGYVLKHLPRIQGSFGRWPTYLLLLAALYHRGPRCPCRRCGCFIDDSNGQCRLLEGSN